MPVGDKYFFIGDRSVAVSSQPILVGDKVICMKYNGGLIHPATPKVGLNTLVMRTKSGKVCISCYTTVAVCLRGWCCGSTAHQSNIYWDGVLLFATSNIPDQPKQEECYDGYSGSREQTYYDTYEQIIKDKLTVTSTLEYNWSASDTTHCRIIQESVKSYKVEFESIPESGATWDDPALRVIFQ